MSMSTHLEGIVPPDAKWRKMKAVYDACSEAGVDAPSEVRNFFNDEPPDDLGVVLDEDTLARRGAVRLLSHDGKQGFEVELKKLPEHVTILRFYNSW